MPANGSEQLRAIAVALKSAGDGVALKRDLTRGIRVAADPLRDSVRTAALRQLPKRGGLNRQVAGQKVTISVLTGARTAGVRLKTTAPDTQQTDSGYVRHPTFGRRGKGEWRTQSVPLARGWWTTTLSIRSAAVTPAILAVMEQTAAKIQRGV